MRSYKVLLIAFIEAEDVIEKILKHLGLWEVKLRPPPRKVSMQSLQIEPWIDYSESKVRPSENGLYVDPPAGDPGADSEYAAALSS